MNLLTGPQRLLQNVGVSFGLDFTPGNFLQGLGCEGDDGFVEVTGVPDGMTFDATSLTISGIPNTIGFYTIIIDVIGTTEDCSQLHNYYQGTIKVEVVLFNYMPATCGPNSARITSLFLIPAESIEVSVMGSAQGVFSYMHTWYDGLLGQNSIEVKFIEGKVEESPKDDPAGPIYDVKIEGTLTKDRSDMERFRRAVHGKDWVAYVVDGNRLQRVYGNSSFALRAMLKLQKGKSNEATLVVQGMLPEGSVVVAA